MTNRKVVISIEDDSDHYLMDLYMYPYPTPKIGDVIYIKIDDSNRRFLPINFNGYYEVVDTCKGTGSELDFKGETIFYNSFPNYDDQMKGYGIKVVKRDLTQKQKSGKWPITVTAISDMSSDL